MVVSSAALLFSISWVLFVQNTPGHTPPATAPKSKGPAGRTQPGLESCGSTHTSGVALPQQLFQAPDVQHPHTPLFQFGFPEQRSQGLVIPNIQINRHFPRPLLRRYLSSSSTLPASSTRSLSSSSSVVESPASLSAAQPGSAPKRFAICRRRMVRSPS